MKRLLAAIAGVAAACHEPAPRAPVAAVCALTEPPVVVREEGAAQLLRWDTDDRAVLFGETMPADEGYRAYRRALLPLYDGLRRPPLDPRPADEAQAALQAREHHNVRAVFDQGAGTVRRIHCLEALLFAHQHARFSQLEHPTEQVVLVLRRDGRLRIYAGASDQLFPPKWAYGLEEARADRADGWRLDVVLHNHTIRTVAGARALGQPTLSTSDVDFFRGLADELGLGAAWVTNGVYTAEIPAAKFRVFLGRDDAR